MFLDYLLQVSLLEQRLDQMVSGGPFQPQILCGSVGEFCLRNKIEKQHVKPFSQPWWESACFSGPPFLLYWSFLPVYVACLSCVMDFNREKGVVTPQQPLLPSWTLDLRDHVQHTVTPLAPVLFGLSLLPSYPHFLSGALFGWYFLLVCVFTDWNKDRLWCSCLCWADSLKWP